MQTPHKRIVRLNIRDWRAVSPVIPSRLRGDELPSFDLALEARRSFDGGTDGDLALHPKQRAVRFVLALLQWLVMNADRKGLVLAFCENEAVRRCLDRVNRSTEFEPP